MLAVVPIDMGGHEIRNVVVHVLAADPVTPKEGQVWFNSADNLLRYYDGTAVIDVGGGGLDFDLAPGQIIYGDSGGVEVAGLPDAAGIVDKSTVQTITGAKTHEGNVTLGGTNRQHIVTSGNEFRTAGRLVLWDNSYSGSQAITANGQHKVYTGTGGHTFTLPSQTSVTYGLMLIENAGTGDVTVARAGTDTIAIDGAGAATSFVLSPGEMAIVFQRQGGSWCAFYAGGSKPSTYAKTADLAAYATDAEVTAAINAVVDAAPGTLDTLNELAAALGDDPNFATTVTNALAAKTGKFAATIGDGAATSYVVTHNLNSRDVIVSVHDATTFDEVIADVKKTTVNTVTITFGAAPALNSYRVTVVG